MKFYCFKTLTSHLFKVFIYNINEAEEKFPAFALPKQFHTSVKEERRQYDKHTITPEGSTLTWNPMQ